MIVVASKNGIVGIKESMRVLEAGGSAVDAVEAGIRLVEANPDDHFVGYSGYPNLSGNLEDIADGDAWQLVRLGPCRATSILSRWLGR